MRYPEHERVEVLLDRDTYDRLKRMVGSRQMSPTIRRLTEQYVAEEPVRRRIERIRREGS